ncbi:UNVERIFIED_CONTAM: hypothetical protein FKN15_053729 [Acipenser sinensis]
MGQQRPDGRTERGWKRAAPINIDTQSGEKKRQTPSDKDSEGTGFVTEKGVKGMGTISAGEVPDYLKMAANAGSMFQYWKRFDLQQLQYTLKYSGRHECMNV